MPGALYRLRAENAKLPGMKPSRAADRARELEHMRSLLPRLSDRDQP